METNKIVFLWSHVRSISTAFERVFIQREDYVTLHEPFGEPCYFGPERISSYHDHDLNAHAEYINTTYSQMIDEILNAANNKAKKNVFVKDMVRHILRPDHMLHPENPTTLPIDFLKRCTHTFILRSPEKSIPSLYRVFVTTNQKFVHSDTGYAEMQVLFEFLTTLTGTRPALVEAGDLLSEPTTIMRMYCESAIHDRFEPSMLEWKAERVKTFDKWPGWHDVAQRSIGLNQFEKKKDEMVELVLPDDVQELIERCMPIYRALYEFRIRL